MEGVVGEVRMWAGNFAPRDWVFCHGQLLDIGNYQTLYSIVSTFYGGDGRTNFGVPDLRGRVPMGDGSAPGLTGHFLGEKNGFEHVKLDVAHMPAHAHTATFHPKEGGGDNGGGDNGTPATGSLWASTEDGVSRTPRTGDYLGAVKGGGASGQSLYKDNADPTSLVQLSGLEISGGGGGGGGGITGGTVTVDPSGQGAPVYNMQPYHVLNFIICVDGTYPSRN